MNEAFFDLSKEKQLRILNAAMEVFSQNEYKHASTDDIAAKAQISKGLLFYYFGNKKDLYLYLYQYVERLTQEAILNEGFETIDDFFDLMEYGAQKKLKLVAEHPYLLDFTIRAFDARDEHLNPELAAKLQAQIGDVSQYFKYVDFSRFRDGVDPGEMLRMLVWMTEGYLQQMRRQRQPVEMEVLLADYQRWTVLFKNMAYKEEFLHEDH
ncbi:MAG: TetR/AcrR family transcriptional regulator [Pygmaiobacter sp.]|nr:TetR/AcrR family transcriptional regulator [Pygmaiobacter sp.]